MNTNRARPAHGRQLAYFGYKTGADNKVIAYTKHTPPTVDMAENNTLLVYRHTLYGYRDYEQNKDGL